MLPLKGMYSKLLLLMMFLIVFMGVFGCASQDSRSMSPMETKAYILVTYNSQFDSHMLATGHTKNIEGVWEKTSSPVLSEDMKKMLRQKKVMLIRVKPMISTYIMLSGGGINYSVESEQQILAILTELSGL